jgi:hypothetical protein
MDPQRLLEQFLGAGGPSPLGGQNSAPQGDAGPLDKLRGAAGTLTSGPMGGFGGGMAAGGLLGLLVGSKKVRKMAGGVVGPPRLSELAGGKIRVSSANGHAD